MELIRGIHNLKQQHHGCALSIGNFDGVHLGHQQVLRQLVAHARAHHLPATVMLFEPQPLELFAGVNAPARLCRFREKYQAIKALGVDRVICVYFNAQFAQMLPSAFIEDLLIKKLGIRYLSVGDDFRFGLNREGNFSMLQQAARQHGFVVADTPSYCISEARVSSTAIRRFLHDGEFISAKQQLGRAFSFSGRVIHGQKLGRQLGFATANMALARRVSPLHGVYAVRIYLEDGSDYAGVANVGSRPTAAGIKMLLESHLFGFSGDLYGQRIVVVPEYKIRNEQKFPSLDALKAQVEFDIKQAKSYYGLAEQPSGMLNQ